MDTRDTDFDRVIETEIRKNNFYNVLYTGTWLFSFVMAVLTVITANCIFKVDLISVANVTLAVSACFIVVTEALLIIAFIIYLVVCLSTGKGWPILLSTAISIIISSSSIYAPIAAFHIFAFFDGVTLHGHSFVYDEIMSFIRSLFSYPAHLISQVFRIVDQAQVADAMDKIAAIVSVGGALLWLWTLSKKALTTKKLNPAI